MIITAGLTCSRKRDSNMTLSPSERPKTDAHAFITFISKNLSTENEG